MNDHEPNTLVKQAALSTLSMGIVLTLAAPMLFHAAEYIGLITVLAALLSVFCGIRLWMGGGIQTRIAALLVGAGAALGQAANATVGLPGASALKGETGPLFWLALAFELLTVLLLTIDGLRKGQV